MLVVVPMGARAGAPGGDAAQADFGAPPSGSVPILFDDRHVYAKPDFVRRGRLLAALVRSGSFMVPLRSMLAVLGAKFAYDPTSRSTLIRRGESRIRLTVGKPVIEIDGERRPLDVPPEMDRGVLLVPIRVIAEVLGAYVQYDAALHAVVIRYVSPTMSVATPSPVVLQPVAPPSPAAAASAPMTRATVGPGPPIPVDRPPLEALVVADVVISPKVDNQFDPGRTGRTGESFAVRAADEFALFDVPFAVGIDFTRFAFQHAPGRVENLGSTGVAFVPGFDGHDSILEGRFTTQVNPEKFNLGLGYADVSSSYGIPHLRGIGFGLEKLPVLSDHLSYDGSIFFYPNIHGVCGCPTGPLDLNYSLLTYRAGLTYGLGSAFLDAGYLGEREAPKGGAPIGITRDGPYAGLGLHL